MTEVEKLKYYVNGKYVESGASRYYDVYNPSTGEVIARAPGCTKEEVEGAIAAARAAYPGWSSTSVTKRASIMFNLQKLIEKNMDELTMMICRENGKAWEEAYGDVGKAKDITEFVCGIPTLMMGESLMNVTTGYDTTLYREPVGVFAGIAPFNFPAMIPMGWMAPICVASGNTFVLKAATMTPMTALKMADLYREAGVPDGVINVVTCSRNEAELFLTHPDVNGVTFVGSTSVGLHVYGTAAANGKSNLLNT